ncbi:MAG: aspartate kinase, partial [Planctomycetota bacterium]
MAIIVQKFGGTSVADAEKIRRAAGRVIKAATQGYQVVVVASARGKQTDQLVADALELNPNPPKREMDQLLSTGEQQSVSLFAMALDAMGHKAISFTGGQVRMMTDSDYTKARIKSIDADRVHKQLDKGKIVIVAGFQGIDENENITTLGRGGSDTTAVALAAALNAEVCEIYTDVDGIYTTDPRMFRNAAKIDQISFDEMLELASLGAGV